MLYITIGMNAEYHGVTAIITTSADGSAGRATDAAGPFLLLPWRGRGHGYALIARLNELVSPGGVDVGMAYRTLRELETEGLVRSVDSRERRSRRSTG
jgi:hypothetical protein